MNAQTQAQQVQHNPLRLQDNCDIVIVARKDLETEHRQLLSRIQLLRRLLGYDPLPTGKQQRIAQAE